jgi:hypothetical protein
MSARILILVSLVGAVTGCEQQPVPADRPQYMTSAERVPYVKDFEPSCLLKLGTGPLSRHLSKEQRAQYCSCAAVRSAETKRSKRSERGIERGTENVSSLIWQQ